VTIVTTGHPTLERETTQGVEIQYLHGTPPRVYSRPWWKKSADAIRELHAERPFDVLHSQSIGAYGFLAQRLNQRLRLPTVLTLHGTPYDEVVSRWNIARHSPSPRTWIGLSRVFYWLEQYLHYYLRAVPRADTVIATSDEQAQLIARLFFLPESKIAKVYNGMDLGLFSPREPDGLGSELGIPADARVLLCVARFARDKGLDQVIRALPRVLEGDPRVRLVLVGDGDERPRLERLVAGLGLGASVHFVGFVPFTELARYFALCDVFINATLRRNGYDLTMLEAMACQRVVISSNIGSTPTLIQDGVDGLLVGVGDRRGLAAKVLEALGDPERRQRIGRAAREKVTRGFDVAAMLEGTLRTYQAARAAHAGA
jgi:glycosyltransferase involved in cell wall biosynthesis